MSAFASLMALSATQTKEQESAVEVTLRERQRKEALRRKQQEEKEAKDREMEKQRRLKLFEDQKREEERRKRVAEEKAARERAMQRREDEERDKLLYGPKKASKMSAASSSNGGGSRGAPGKRRSSDESDDDSGPIPLTREELRQRKQEREMKRMYGATKRSAGSSGGSYQKAGRRLPGGAVDITIDPTASKSATEYKSVKERLIAQQNTLVKLNPNKRDTRTIDEIVTQRAMAKQHKTLEGEQAKEFDDWFGTKKKEKETDKKTVASRPSSVGPLPTPSGKLTLLDVFVASYPLFQHRKPRNRHCRPQGQSHLHHHDRLHLRIDRPHLAHPFPPSTLTIEAWTVSNPQAPSQPTKDLHLTHHGRLEISPGNVLGP
jgi:protein SPT2